MYWLLVVYLHAQMFVHSVFTIWINSAAKKTMTQNWNLPMKFKATPHTIGYTVAFYQQRFDLKRKRWTDFPDGPSNLCVSITVGFPWFCSIFNVKALPSTSCSTGFMRWYNYSKVSRSCEKLVALWSFKDVVFTMSHLSATIPIKKKE